MRFRLVTLFAVTTCSSIALAVFWPSEYPAEVRRIIATLPNVPTDADLMTAARMLIQPLRRPSYGELDRPETNPRYYIEIDDRYRLVLDTTCTITTDAKGIKYVGKSVFDGAFVEEKVDGVLWTWRPIYPIRKANEMKYRPD